ncbi:MAG: DUF523 and DUF1722 domain-containing protein [Planctomycetes bacterium]|nr:DUF523 and DUF1722 domain-containing protein [Planctomycetota bacterium]
MPPAAPAPAAPSPRPLRIGVSACLLGEEVRYDGGHRRDRWLTDTLGPFAEFVPVCPEVELGLGVPRPTIRLEQDGAGGLRLVEPSSRADLTDRMARYAERRTKALSREDLDGFVLKKNSPSCGMERVKVWTAKGMPARRDGRGLFAGALLAGMPLLPVEEEGRLGDARLRDNFVERLFAGRRAREALGGRWTVGDLVRFHTGEKLLLMAHDVEAYRRLGRLVAGAKGRPREEVRAEYLAGYMTALARIATVRRHANVLEHMAGYFKDVLDAEGKAELHGLLADHRRGLVPLVVPLTLLRHLVRLHRVEYLAGQRYLDPHPKELMLRNHV